MQTKKRNFSLHLKSKILKINLLMKKFIYFLFLFISIISFAQTQYSVTQVENSTDPQVIALFIKFNPDHPRTPEFKSKLISIINSGAVPASQSSKKSTAVNNSYSNKSIASINSKPNRKKTVDLLNHLFNSDPSSTTAYVQIINRSNCNLNVRISGKRAYSLAVPANNENFVLVDKGSYAVTTSVCNASYSSTKNIAKDIVITLSAPK